MQIFLLLNSLSQVFSHCLHGTYSRRQAHGRSRLNCVSFFFFFQKTGKILHTYFVQPIIDKETEQTYNAKTHYATDYLLCQIKCSLEKYELDAFEK